MARLALAGALLFLAGQPQTAFHGAYAAAIVVGTALLQRRIREGEAPRSPLPVAGALAGAGVLAVLLVSAQLLPTMDLASRSARAVLPYSTVVSGAFHPVDAIRFAVPEFFGTPLTRDEWSALFPRGEGSMTFIGWGWTFMPSAGNPWVDVLGRAIDQSHPVPPLPEPGVLALCGIAALGIVWRRRRQKRTT